MPAMDEKTKIKSSSALLNIAAFIIIVAGMREASTLLVPFLLALFIAIICSPPFLWLKRRGVPTAIALLIVIIGILAIGSFVGTVVGTSMNSFLSNLPVYEDQLKDKAAEIISLLQQVGIEIPRDQILDSFNPQDPLRLIGGILSGLGKVLSSTFLILITVIFIMLEFSGFPAKLRAASDDPDVAMSSYFKIYENIKRYMAFKTLICMGTGIGITILLILIGVDYPLLWGLIAFLLNYIPSIGSYIAALPGVLLALIQFGLGTSIITAAGYFFVNTLFGNFIEPRLMGQGLGLSTLVVFLSLVFWGWVLGPVGMLLSVPLTMAFKIALDSKVDTRWAAILLGSDVPKQHQ
jgi:predicted PurR-regulated permease PerM